MLCVSRVAVFLRRSKAWRNDPRTDPTFMYDVTATYETIVLTAAQISDITVAFKQRFADGKVDSTFFFKTHLALVRLYPLALGVAVVLGCLVTGVNPLYPGLQDEMRRCATETLASAQHLDKYRPLGSSVVPFCLAMCWLGTDDMEVRAQIQRVCGEYMQDYPAVGYEASFMARMASLERKFKLQD